MYNKRELTFNKRVINHYIIMLPICRHLISHSSLSFSITVELRTANLLLLNDLLAGS